MRTHNNQFYNSLTSIFYVFLQFNSLLLNASSIASVTTVSATLSITFCCDSTMSSSFCDVTGLLSSCDITLISSFCVSVLIFSFVSGTCSVSVFLGSSVFYKIIKQKEVSKKLKANFHVYHLFTFAKKWHNLPYKYSSMLHV